MTAQNSRAMNRFKQDIVGSMVSFSRSTIQQAAKMGLQHMINQAGFNDYTGKLINSYQAAILTKGGIDERISRMRSGVWNERGIFGGTTPIMITSYGMPGTTSISHRTVTATNRAGKTYKGFRMRVRRDGGESPDVRRLQKVWGNRESKYTKGFGHNITAIKGIAPPISSGYWLVFTNAAPYALSVHKGEGRDHRGRLVKGTPHRVFPDRGADINLYGIAQQELKKAIARYKRKYK